MEKKGVIQPSLKEMLIYFLKLGTFGFGGPVVLCEHMRRDLVDGKHWISPDEYSEGFALSQLAPGPLAAQLAIYLGWARGGISWATTVGLAFILPSLIIVFLLAALYMAYGGLSWIQGAFYGIGASVIAIITMSAYRLVTKSFKKDYLLWFFGVASALITIATESENLWIFLIAGLIVMMIRARPRFGSNKNFLSISSLFFTGIHGSESLSTLNQIFLFFFKSGAVVFGSGLAIVPFLHSGVVLEHQWLNERQFLDAVAVAMITPGPVVITVGFIGYLIAGLTGGLVAALAVFLPCYLFVIIPAPYYSRFAKNESIKALVNGITAAAIGAIAGAAFVLGKRAIFDVATTLIAIVTLLILIKTKKIPEPILIILAGIVGILLKGF